MPYILNIFTGEFDYYEPGSGVVDPPTFTGETLQPTSYTSDILLIHLKSSVGALQFYGTGLNDLSKQGTYISGRLKSYSIVIDATGTPDTFKWSNDGGGTYPNFGIPITGNWQDLDSGMQVKFTATTGHTLTDEWYFEAYPHIGKIIKVLDPVGNEVQSIVLSGNGLNLNTNTEKDIDVSIGKNAGRDSEGYNNIWIGKNTGTLCRLTSANVFIGEDIYGSTNGSFNIHIGKNITSEHPTQNEDSIAIGADISVGVNDMVIGGPQNVIIKQAYFGQGKIGSGGDKPFGIVFNATGANGTNIEGGDFTLAAGKSTGSAAGGKIIFKTSPAGGGGSSLNSLVECGSINSQGRWFISVPNSAPVGTELFNGSLSLYIDESTDTVKILVKESTGSTYTITIGIGDVVGPASATDSNFAAFDTTTGKLIKDSGYTASSFDSNGAAGSVQSNLTTHQGLTASVHGFDASGNAPAQTHGMERHSAISHTALTDKGTNTHAQIDTALSDLATNTKTFYNIMSTGRKTGGTITITSGQPSKFDMALGTGVVVNNYTDPNDPVFTNVSWPARTAQTLTYLASADETAIGIDSSGAIVQNNVPFGEIDWHDVIQIATIGHWSRSQIDYIIMEPHGIISPMTQLQGFWAAFGPFSMGGNEFTANGANMKLNKSGGDTFNQCIGVVKTPNVISSSSGTAVYFSYYYQSSPGVWVETALTQNIDDLKYDTGSGLGTVPVGKFTIQTIFFYAPLWVNGGSTEYSVDIQYGQVVYDTMAQAQAAITSNIKFNDYLAYDTFRTWLIVKRGTTSLQSASDALFIQAPPLKFGTMAATGGGSTGEANTVSNVGTAGVGLYLQKTGVDFEFKNAEAASTKITVTDYPTNKTVRLDVATGTTSGTVCVGDDSRLSDARTPLAHNLAGTEHNSDTLANLNSKVSDADVVALAGQIGGTAASPDIRGIRETSGPTLLTLGAIADGQYLLRSGTNIISGSPGSGPGGLTLTTVEVSLGTKPLRAGKFSITTSGLTSGRPVLIFQSQGPYTGKGTIATDDVMERILVYGKTTSTTNIDCWWESPTRLKGNAKFNYAVG